jgi:hypothetical protein
MKQTYKPFGLDRGTSTNPFCGPVALALLLERPLNEIDKLLEPILGTEVKRGIFYPEILKILVEQGYSYSQVPATFPSRARAGLFLICFQGHVGVIKNQIYFDNQIPSGIIAMSYQSSYALKTAFEIKKKKL